jgi:hypothetical protein
MEYSGYDFGTSSLRSLTLSHEERGVRLPE